MARQVCEDKSRDMALSSGFCFNSDVSSGNPTIQTHLVMNQIQGFVSDPEMFNLTTGMEMIGFSKNLQQQPSHDSNPIMWKSFLSKTGQHHQGASSSKTMNESSSFYHQPEYNNKPDFTSRITETSSENLMVGVHDSSSWQDNTRSLVIDDSSLRCVFPCEGNERPSQGLSLSLSSTDPSSIGLQPFELRHTTHHHHHQHQQPDFVSSSSSRDGFYEKSANAQQQQQQMLQALNIYQGHFMLKSSKFLVPAQDLLNELCSLGTKLNDVVKQKSHQKNKQTWEENNSTSKKQSLTALEFVELQKRKTTLLSMLEEVDRRYRHYCNQMKAVVSSFEAVAGNGAATVYSALALKAMSRHFRCLKDGILDQIQVTRRAIGEKDPVAPGTTRGETPRLKIIDQAIRQHRTFQQVNMMETHPWRPQRGLPERAVSVLRAWLFEHFLHPYPSDVDKHILARHTGLSRSQVSNWFINARVRLWKPMVEEMYLEEANEQENNMACSEGGTDIKQDEEVISQNVQNTSPAALPDDQKPTQPRLLRIDSECVSTIINNPDHKDNPKSSKTIQHHVNPQEQCFGSVELDFSSYTHHYDQNANQSFNGGSGGGGGVSLTLGLQQHGGSGVGLAFSPATQSSMFYTRDQVDQADQCQTVQYSILDGEAQSMPYRNLMGTQLLHDFAG